MLINFLNIYFEQCGVDEHAGRQGVYREEQPSATRTPQMNYELEVTVTDHNEYISIKIYS